MTAVSALLTPEDLQSSGSGPLYMKLQQALERAINSGRLSSGDALPAERDLAEYANISRVTVRKAVDELIAEGRAAKLGPAPDHQGPGRAPTLYELR